jgi:hypothetical protein
MGPSTRSTVCDGGARHGFAVRTHPGYAEDAAKQSFDEAKRFLTRRSQENLVSAVQTRLAHHFFDRQSNRYSHDRRTMLLGPSSWTSLSAGTRLEPQTRRRRTGAAMSLFRNGAIPAVSQ